MTLSSACVAEILRQREGEVGRDQAGVAAEGDGGAIPGAAEG